MTTALDKKQQKAAAEILKKNIASVSMLDKAKRQAAKKFGIGLLPNSLLWLEYQRLLKQEKIKTNPSLEKILKKRPIRTLSGIAPVAVLTKPYPCPGKCAYCPTQKNVPQSYLSNEPAVMRAIRCNYHPYRQVQDRLRALEANAHQPTKIELIVIGGTWSVLPRQYQYWYILNCFAAANDWHKRERANFYRQNASLSALRDQLKKEQKRNEKTRYRIVGLTLETRPDYITPQELIRMRELGCTRVEIGVQAIDDKILALNKRGHGVAETVQATKLLKQFGFKVTYHIMPGLPGSSYKKDLKMFARLFADERFQPDQIKFYPTVVTRGSLLYKWWRTGKYKPYTQTQLQNLIIACKKIVPRYVRIIRLIRDIPAESIIAGNLITNLRQEMKKQGAVCNCIRCREARDKPLPKSLKLFITKYKASGGEEIFLSYEDESRSTLYGFCRLRLPARQPEQYLPPALRQAAIIRELHVYGELVGVGEKTKKIQHAGLGRKLMAKAEKIAQKNGWSKIAVIAGIGVRDYYRKLGYRVQDTYMVKKLKNAS
jgi:elongator complex protein 3